MIIKDNFCYLCRKTYVETPHLNRLARWDLLVEDLLKLAVLTKSIVKCANISCWQKGGGFVPMAKLLLLKE